MSNLSGLGYRLWRTLPALAAFALASGWASTARAEEPSPTPTPGVVLNERHPLPGVLTGGLPAGEPRFQALAGAGVRTLIDLRSDPEIPPGTRSAAQAAGIAYEQVPVSGDTDLNLGSARALDSLLDDPSRYPVAIVCASGNRVGALLAVRAFWLDGANPEPALALGRAAGLSRLEPSVRLLLGLTPAPATRTPQPN